MQNTKKLSKELESKDTSKDTGVRHSPIIRVPDNFEVYF